MSFAKIVVAGTLTSDPEKRFTPNNHAVTNFNLSVENPAFGKDNGPFTVQVTCWRGLADAVETQLCKGDNVVIDGKLMLNNFQGQDGVQKKSFEIEANSIEKLPGPSQPVLVAAGEASEGRSSRPSAPQGGFVPQASPQPSGGFSSEELLTEDDIPF